MNSPRGEFSQHARLTSLAPLPEDLMNPLARNPEEGSRISQAQSIPNQRLRRLARSPLGTFGFVCSLLNRLLRKSECAPASGCKPNFIGDLDGPR
jgi:hypothetical protein